METRPDIGVIGGGIIGLAVAFELAQRGRSVTVLEAGAVGERAAAWAAAGMIAPASESDISDPRLTRLALASHNRYPEWTQAIERVSGMKTGYDRTGTLFVALDRDHLALLERLESFQLERGLRVERLGANTLLEMEPELSPAAAGGLYLRDDHQVNPRLLLRALAAGLQASGGTLLEHCSVERLDLQEDGVAVHVQRHGTSEVIEARQVVLATGAWPAGAWSAAIEAPIAPLPSRPVKGQILRLRGERLLRHVVRTPEIYLVPRDDGELVAGASMELQGFDARATAGPVYELLRDAEHVLPAMRGLELAECSVGFRPTLRDHMPAIGSVGSDRLFIATGHFRSGVELAPVTARLLADLVCEGREDPLLEPFSPLRFGAVGATA